MLCLQNIKSRLILLTVIKKGFQLAFITSLCFITACTYNSSIEKIYTKNDEPVSFDGIVDIVNSSDRNINIIFVHGMGGYSKTDGVVDPCQVMKNLQIALPDLKKEFDNDYNYCAGRYFFGDNPRRVINSAVNEFSLLTKLTKDELNNADNDAVMTQYRLPLTQTAKSQFFNFRVADAFIYVGEARQQIIRNVISTIERAQNDNPDALNIIITFSLGSKVIVDAVKQLDKENKLNLLRNTVPMIYMMANQIPLLSLTDFPLNLPGGSGVASNGKNVQAAYVSEVKDQYDTLGKLFSSASGKQIFSLNSTKARLIAFSDPNDLLSYTIQQDNAEKFKDSYANVIISVADEILYIPFFKSDTSLANPLKAHTGYVHNEAVNQLLMFGHKATE